MPALNADELADKMEALADEELAYVAIHAITDGGRTVNPMVYRAAFAVLAYRWNAEAMDAAMARVDGDERGYVEWRDFLAGHPEVHDLDAALPSDLRTLSEELLEQAEQLRRGPETRGGARGHR